VIEEGTARWGLNESGFLRFLSPVDSIGVRRTDLARLTELGMPARGIYSRSSSVGNDGDALNLNQ
jgi:hypothetical protein